MDEFLRSAARSITQVSLPESHLQLLKYLQEDEQRLVQATPGLQPTVARSDFLSVDLLQKALQEAGGTQLQHS